MNAPGKSLHALGGYLLDIYKLATCQLVNPHSYLKYLGINQARKATRGRTFIETGTYLGGTACRAGKVFDVVYTIELDPGLARKAKQNLARYPNIEVIHGDATVELEKIFAKKAVERVIVFLDGHFSGGDTASGAIPEPAVVEIEILGRYRNRINAVIIDDFRNFGEEPGHPPKWALLQAIDNHFPRTEFNLQVQNDQVIVTRKCVV